MPNQLSRRTVELAIAALHAAAQAAGEGVISSELLGATSLVAPDLGEDGQPPSRESALAREYLQAADEIEASNPRPISCPFPGCQLDEIHWVTAHLGGSDWAFKHALPDDQPLHRPANP